jgi:bisphosphoglycerate-dependent phosphoglycerate mutase
MSAGEVARLNVPTATPLVYEFGPDLRPLGPGHALGTGIPGE